MKLAGQSKWGEYFSCRPPWSCGANARYCPHVTGLAARAKFRLIRTLCRRSISCRSASTSGEPMTNCTGPGTATIVWPWPLTYHCGTGSFSGAKPFTTASRRLARAASSAAQPSLTRCSQSS